MDEGERAGGVESSQAESYTHSRRENETRGNQRESEEEPT